MEYSLFGFGGVHCYAPILRMKMAIVSYTSSIPQNDISNYSGHYIKQLHPPPLQPPNVYAKTQPYIHNELCPAFSSSRYTFAGCTCSVLSSLTSTLAGFPVLSPANSLLLPKLGGSRHILLSRSCWLNTKRPSLIRSLIAVLRSGWRYGLPTWVVAYLPQRSSLFVFWFFCLFCRGAVPYWCTLPCPGYMPAFAAPAYGHSL